MPTETALTQSVMHNRLVAAGMLGCAHFGIEAFPVATSSALLAALLLWDVHAGERSDADPRRALPGPGRGGSPLCLFQQNACHGGTWRAAFRTNGYTEVSALLYLMAQARPYVAGAAAAAALRGQRRRASSRL